MSQPTDNHRAHLSCSIVVMVCFGAAAAYPQAGTPDRAALRPYAEKFAGTVVSLDMVPVAPEGRPAFWMSRTEVTWDLYDLYAFGLDRPGPTNPSGADAVSRPSRPYTLPGEHFGHAGHPAIGMTFHAAQSFAAWMAAKTGHRYRLPTEAEWEAACRLGRTDPAHAWLANNAGERTHPVGGRDPNELGLHDLLGNVAEWTLGAGGPVAQGGAYTDDPGGVNCAASKTQTPAWNATDPQLPKSRWWLTDAPFVGIRLVREP